MIIPHIPFRQLKHTFNQAMSSLEDFIHQETSSGIVLMVCAVVALVIANSPLYPLYDELLHKKIVIGTEGYFRQVTG